VVRALREGFWTGMQAGAGNNGTQVEEDVQRALNSRLLGMNASRRRTQ